MTYLPRAGADHPLATPVVASVVTSLGADATSPRAIRPWTHAGYTRWRRAALQAMPVALVVGLLLLAVGRQIGRPVVPAGLWAVMGSCWLASAWVIARRR
ncbi:MAG TPA: hypothetical protein VKA84_05000 [Gemmatimonadaceae bacterium]|nr:hypothetical protein [Gemmatimonadaceae bacterium]